MVTSELPGRPAYYVGILLTHVLINRRNDPVRDRTTRLCLWEQMRDVNVNSCHPRGVSDGSLLAVYQT